MNISITGNLGAGKSSICKILKAHGYEIISAGTIFRQLAQERGLSVEELNAQVNSQIEGGGLSEIDTLIDERTTQISRERDMVVFDARLGWHFAENTFRIFVYVDIDEAARRIYGDSSRAASEHYDSLEECRAAIIHRQHLEAERFKDLYRLDYYNLRNYDLIIDSTYATPEELSEVILAEAADFAIRAGRTDVSTEENVAGNIPRIILSPLNLYPAKALSEYPAGDKDNDCQPVRAGVVGSKWLYTEGAGMQMKAAGRKETFLDVAYDTVSGGRLLTPDEYAEFENAGGFVYKRYPSEQDFVEKGIVHFI